MDNQELQVENGSYTRIVNKIIDDLAGANLLGSEFRIVLCVIRKTYGFNKKSDRISLSQFEKATGLSHPTVNKALKNLVKMALLVKTASLQYSFNKYSKTWVVNTASLVKHNGVGSKARLTSIGKAVLTKTGKAVLTHKRQKDILKDNTKEREQARSPNQISESFFSNSGGEVDKVVEMLKGKGVPETVARSELDKFIRYWTERNGTGTRERWQMEKTFEVRQRLTTWIQKVRDFSKPPNQRTRKILKA